jgi:hypothetical protein
MSQASDSALRDGLTYRHERIIDFMLANPQMRKGEIAAALGFTQAWFSTITSSDAFRAEYSRRRQEWNERLAEGVIGDLYDQTQLAAKRIIAELESPDCAPGFALEVQGRALSHLGFGTRDRPQPGGQAQVVVNVAGINPELLARAREKMLLTAAPSSLAVECPALPSTYLPEPEGDGR